MKRITKKVIDGKEVIVRSEFKELTEQAVRNELSAIHSHKQGIINRVYELKGQYNALLEEEEFYLEELEKFEQDEEYSEDIFDI